MIKRSLIILVLFCSAATALAQQRNNSIQEVTDCQERLRAAEAAYQSGQFMSSIKLLEVSLDSCDFSRKEKEQALELLAKSYVEAGEPGKAETTINIMLKKFPHYDLREDRNPEMFNRMVKRYEIHPMLVIAAKNTAFWPIFKTTRVYSVLPALDYSQPQAKRDYFFTYYACGEYEFLKGLSINVDGMFFNTYLSRIFDEGETFYLSVWQYLRFIEFPFYLKKYFEINDNLRFYISAGYGPFYNYYARADLDILYSKNDSLITGKNQDFDASIRNLDILPLSNQLTGQWNVGAGFGYHYRNLRFYLDIRYLGEVGSFKAPENSDAIPVLKNEFFYIDQEMKFNEFEVGVTISYAIFNSVKRKNPK